ncbi:hypothetical protein O0S10_00715 [Methanocorpusculum sp. MG]|uniref:Ribbon-helix-helix protein CopG domain-containing protein n=1 Tax=Methanocorpusculum petauri TaxID=3002863 RepID=A0ABT4IDC7_9EURY|nr:hypothetical protein [Methanocorpusculum petauri]MCZ0859745.1 hypothetical protein [Methanocorpusculum petauri]
MTQQRPRIRKNLGQLMQETSRQNYTVGIHVLATEEMATDIVNTIRTTGMARSDAIRHILKKGLDQIKKEP